MLCSDLFLYFCNYPARIHHSCHRSLLCNSSSCGKTPICRFAVWGKPDKDKRSPDILTVVRELSDSEHFHVQGFPNKHDNLLSVWAILISMALKIYTYWARVSFITGDLQSIRLHRCSCRSRPGSAGSHLHPDRWCTGLTWCRRSAGPGSSPLGIGTARRLGAQTHKTQDTIGKMYNAD